MCYLGDVFCRRLRWDLHCKKTAAASAVAALMTLAVVTAGCTAPTTSPSPTPTPITQTATTTNNNTTITSTAGFTITFPSKYKYDQNGSTPVKTIVYLDPNDAVTTVSVGTDQLQPNTTLDVLADYYKEQLLNFKNFTTVRNVTNTTLGGKPAKTITFTAFVPVQYNQTSVKNQTLQIQQTWAINKDTGFILSYKAVPSNFTKYLPEAQKITNSFQLT